VNPQEADRRKKLEALREAGIDPFGGRYPGAMPIHDVLAACSENEEKPVKAAGRIMAIRGHGKAVFLDIKDWTGKIQVYIRRDKVGPEKFELVELLDLGDILGVEGGLAKTRTGEITIFAADFRILSKALLPLPEKWHGLKDVELRYRQRSLDLICNDDVMKTFMTRTRIISAIRRYLDERGFVEVETPMMQPIPGGAAARPFITHHNTLDIDLYLRISPELYLKRLLVGGMEKVYEINRNFRNEGISTKHNPEFTMMEVYEAYADYNVMMELTEDLICTLIAEAFGPGAEEIPYGDGVISVRRPWARRKYADLLKEYAGIDLEDEAAVREKSRELGIEAPGASVGFLANEIFEKLVEEHLQDPTFVLDYPIDICPLTKACPDNPRLAQRFELYICGTETANAYTELNDPIEQRKRFEQQLAQETEGAKEIDEEFVTAMKHGMPPAGGLGIGIDRLIMFLTDNQSIRDVLLFPQLRPRRTGERKEDGEDAEMIQLEGKRPKGIVVLSFSGHLDAETVPSVKKELHEVLERGAVKLVLDFGGVEFIGSIGLAMLFETSKRATAGGGGLHLAGVRGLVREVFEKSQWLKQDRTRTFRIFDTVEDAVAAFGGAEGDNAPPGEDKS